MQAVIGALRATLGLDSAAFEAGAKSAERRMARMADRLGRTGRRMQSVGTRMSIGVTLPLVALAKKSIDAAGKQEQAVKSMEAVLESMGDGAGYTSEQLQGMASDLQGVSTFGDEDILTGVTANLLTFGNISGKVFSDAQQLALDLSARLGTDLQGSAIMLGKALNDPVTGLTALSRVGVSFTEDQKAMIKAMAEGGNVAGAQALMIEELQRQYSGQAAALAATDTGKMTQASMAIGDAMEKIGAVMLPILGDLAVRVKEMVEAFSDLSPETQRWVVIAGGIAAAVGPAVAALGLMLRGIRPIRVALAAMTWPIGLAVLAIGGLGVAVYKNWDVIREKYPAIAGLITGVADGLRDALERAKAAIVGVMDGIEVVVVGLGDTVENVLNGKWSDAWAGLSMAGQGALDALQEIVDFFFNDAVQAFGVWGNRMIGSFAASLSDGVGQVGVATGELWDAIRTEVASWPGRMRDAGVRAITGLIDGIRSMIPGLTSEMQGIPNITVDALPSGVPLPMSDIGAGGVKGVEDYLSDLEGAGARAADAVEDGFRSQAEIRSPSRVFARLGTMLMQGLAGGIDSGVEGPLERMRAAAGSIAGEMQAGTFDPAIAGADAFGDSVDAAARRGAAGMERLGGIIAGLLKGTTTLRDAAANLFSEFGGSLISAGLGSLRGSGEASGGGLASLATGLIGSLLGFQYGGSFEVGGMGGIDSQVVAFRASPGEMVNVTRNGSPGANLGGGADQVVVRIDDDGGLRGYVEGTSKRVSVQTTQAGLGRYDQARRRNANAESAALQTRGTLR